MSVLLPEVSCWRFAQAGKTLGDGMRSSIEINFYDDEAVPGTTAAVLSESSTTGAQADYLDVAHFSLYLGRVLHEVERHDLRDQEGETQARSLAGLFEMLWNDPSAVREFADAEEVGGVHIFEYTEPGRWRFESRLDIPRDSATGLVLRSHGDIGADVSHSYKPGGFGFLGTGHSDYVPLSVITLMRHMLFDHDSGEFAASVVGAGMVVGQMALSGELHEGDRSPSGYLRGQTRALAAAAKCCRDLGKNQWLGDHADMVWLRDIIDE